MTEIKTINPKTLKSWLEQNDTVLVDVREPVEYKEYCIAKAFNIPLSQLLVGIHQIPNLTKKKLVLHCKVGIRSMMGCQALEKDGFSENIWNLEGGIDSWSSAGFPVKRSNV